MMTMKSNLLLLLLSLLVVQSYGQSFLKSGIVGEGATVEKTISVQKFNGVRNAFSCDVYITQGAEQSITVKAQQNILENMTFEVSNGLLTINRDRLIKRGDKIEVLITMPYFTELSLSGSGSLQTNTLFSDMDHVQVSVSGSGRMDVRTEARAITSQVSGSGRIYFDGSVDEFSITISGSGKIDAEALASNRCDVNISGSGNATVLVHDELDAKISGSGNVRYHGDVARIQSRVSGSGHVRSMN